MFKFSAVFEAVSQGKWWWGGVKSEGSSFLAGVETDEDARSLHRRLIGKFGVREKLD